MMRSTKKRIATMVDRPTAQQNKWMVKMDANDDLNPALTVNDLKQVLERATFRLSCASLKRFSQLEKDVLCTTNAAFREKCPNFCADATDVPTFVLDQSTTDEPVETFLMRNLQGSYMLQPAERWKTIAYVDNVDLDECKRRCIENIGCTCKLATFNSDTKECTLDCPTKQAIADNLDITSVPFVASSTNAIESTSFEKIRV